MPLSMSIPITVILVSLAVLFASAIVHTITKNEAVKERAGTAGLYAWLLCLLAAIWILIVLVASIFQ